MCNTKALFPNCHSSLLPADGNVYTQYLYYCSTVVPLIVSSNKLFIQTRYSLILILTHLTLGIGTQRSDLEVQIVLQTLRWERKYCHNQEKETRSKDLEQGGFPTAQLQNIGLVQLTMDRLYTHAKEPVLP